MAWVAVGSAGVGVAGTIFGAIKSAREQKANQKILDEQLAQSKTDENRNFLDSAAGKDAATAAQNNLIDQRKNIAGRAAVTGASDEAVVAGNSSANKNYNDTLSRIAGYGTNFQERAKNRTMRLQGEQMQLNQQQADSAANLASNASDVMGSAAMLSGMKGETAGTRDGAGITPEMKSASYTPLNTPKVSNDLMPM